MPSNCLATSDVLTAYEHSPLYAIPRTPCQQGVLQAMASCPEWRTNLARKPFSMLVSQVSLQKLKYRTIRPTPKPEAKRLHGFLPSYSPWSRGHARHWCNEGHEESFLLFCATSFCAPWISLLRSRTCRPWCLSRRTRWSGCYGDLTIGIVHTLHRVCIQPCSDPLHWASHTPCSLTPAVLPVSEA